MLNEGAVEDDEAIPSFLIVIYGYFGGALPIGSSGASACGHVRRW